MKLTRTKVNGVGIYPFSSIDMLLSYADQEKGILIALNAAKITKATDQTRAIINENIGYCDGIGAVMAMKQKGHKEAFKIPGCELWLKVIEKFYKEKTFYLVGAEQAVIDNTVEKLNVDYPGIKILGYRNGFIKSNEEKETLINDIIEKKPDVVFVAMGSPRQEFLMSELLTKHRAIYQGLGGSFNAYTGHFKRAPKWWIDHNLEFFYQLIKQPTRIKRQICYFKFMFLLYTRQL